MAKNNDGTTIDDGAQYRVVMKRVVRRGRSVLRPGDDIILKGKIVRELEDDIAEFRAIPA